MTLDDKEQLRLAALQNVHAIAEVRARFERELLQTKEALEEQTRFLELLNATGARLASNLDLKSVVQIVTDAATELTGAQFGAFFYTTTGADGDAWTLYTLSGAAQDAFAKFPHPRATPLFGPTFRGEGPIRISNVHQDPRFGKWAPHYGMPPGHLAVCSYLAVPVTSRSGEPIGGLFFGHAQPDVFTERAERLAVGIAGQAAIAIDNARLYEAAKQVAETQARLLEVEHAARLESERAGRIKDEFLATLSHELRTPLNSILGWSSLLLARMDAADANRRAVQTILRNAQAQTRLVDDLLDMSRIISGKLDLELRPVDLSPIVLNAIEGIRPAAEAKQIALNTALELTPGLVLADPNRIQQVLWNVLANAVKFTPRLGTVSVMLQHLPGSYEIMIQDNGIGIAPEFLPHVFERFSQADSSIRRQAGGLGLGLAIARQIIELHGGSIRAESPQAAPEQPAAKGTAFIICLPLQAPVTASSPNTGDVVA